MHSLDAYTRARGVRRHPRPRRPRQPGHGRARPRLTGKPVVATLHGPADPITQQMLSSLRSRPALHRHQRLPARGLPGPRLRRHHPQRHRRGAHAVQRGEGRLSAVHRPHDAGQGRAHGHRGRAASGPAAHPGRQGQRGSGARLLRRRGRAIPLGEHPLPRRGGPRHQGASSTSAPAAPCSPSSGRSRSAS